MTQKKQNCWEFKKCEREPGGALADERGICPAATEERLDGVHEGKCSGRACWLVAGTFCGGKAQGVFAQKYDTCKTCDFYKKVLEEEAGGFELTLSLMKRLKKTSGRVDISSKMLGVLIGGSGLIGGGLMHYFKTKTSSEIEVLAPNSKKLSLREPNDIKDYFRKFRPDFIINTAIAALDSDPQLAFEVNYMGSINLAKMALALRIPYIHVSSASTMPMGEDLREEDRLPLSADMANYAKSKLMAELTLRHMHETMGLDYTNVRLAVVYGKHDHKIQGFHRLLFSVVDQAMPVMLTKNGIRHSYSNAKKLPRFIHYILEHRDEFTGKTYNFVDREPVELVSLIRAIKRHMGLTRPKEIYLPYSLARFGKTSIQWLVRKLNRIGVEARMPAELMFLENCYVSQTLSAKKTQKTSYIDPAPELTIFTRLPALIEYYLTRWKHFNLLTAGYERELYDPQKKIEEFIHSPESLIELIHNQGGSLRPASSDIAEDLLVDSS